MTLSLPLVAIDCSLTRRYSGEPVFHEAAAPTSEELQALLVKIISRIMRLLTRQGIVIEEHDRSYLAEADRESSLSPLQAASCTYRIALGPPVVLGRKY